MTELEVIDTFGNPTIIEAQIGDARVHGYENESGSWSLYGGEGWFPCSQVALRLKRKRKFRWFSRSRIIHCPALNIFKEEPKP